MSELAFDERPHVSADAAAKHDAAGALSMLDEAHRLELQRMNLAWAERLRHAEAQRLRAADALEGKEDELVELGQKHLERCEQLQAQLLAAKDALLESTRCAGVLEKRLQSEQHGREQLQHHRNTLIEEIDGAKARERERDARVAASAHAMQALQGERDAVRQALQEQQGERDAVRQALQEQQSAAAKLQAQLDAADAHRAIVEQHRQSLIVDADRLRQELYGLHKEREEIKAQLRVAAERHAAEILAAKDALLDATRSAGALEMRLQAQQHGREQLQHHRDTLLEELDGANARQRERDAQWAASAQATQALKDERDAVRQALREQQSAAERLQAQLDAADAHRALVEQHRQWLLVDADRLREESIESARLRAQLRDDLQASIAAAGLESKALQEELAEQRNEVARAAATGEQRQRDIDLLHQEREDLRAQLRIAAERHADAVAALDTRVTTLHQDAQRCRSAVLAAERAADKSRRTLSYQLGHALVMAGKTWGGFSRLPGTLLDLRRQARAGRFGGSGAGPALGGPDDGASPRTSLVAQIEERFEVGGIDAAQARLNEAGDRVPAVELAHGYTRLAKLALGIQPAQACRLARQAVQLDPRAFRRKWLAFLLFDAGRISEAHELLISLPDDETLKPSQRHKAERIAGLHRLLEATPRLDRAPAPTLEAKAGPSVAPGRPKPLTAPLGGSERSELGGPSVAPGRPKPLTAPSGGSERSELGGPSVAPGRPKPLTPPSGDSERSELGGPVLYVAASALPYHVSGYTMRTHSLLRALLALGHDVVCVTRPGYPDDRNDAAQARTQDVLQIDGVRYESLPGAHRNKVAADLYFEQAAQRLVEKAQSSGARAIHAASNYENALPALMAARRLGLPFIYEVRGLWEYTAATKRPGWEDTEVFELDRRLETFVARHADRVYTLNQPLADELVRRGVDRSNIALAPNAIDVDAFRRLPRDADLARQLGIEHDAFVVGYVGSVLGYEGLDDLLLAVSRLREVLPRVRGLIVGDGESLASLRTQAQGLGIADRVSFVGKVAPAEVPRYFSLFDAAALPRKPFTVCQLVSPLKPLEAMAMQVPVVVSDVGALREMVNDGKTGLVFEAGRADALAARLLELATTPGLRERIAAAAYADVAATRSWAAVAAMLASTYPPANAPAHAPHAPPAPAPAPVAACTAQVVAARSPAASASVPMAPAGPSAVVLPAGRNAMTAGEKAAFDDALQVALARGGVVAIEHLVQQQVDGRSAKFAAFCELKAAHACLAGGQVDAALGLAERSLQHDRGPGGLRGVARLYSNAARLERAAELADEIEAKSPSVEGADRRLIDELRGRARLAQWAAQPAAPRGVPVRARRVLNVLAFSLPYTSVGYATRSHGLAQGIAQSGWDVRAYTRPGFPFDFKPELADQTLPTSDRIDGIVYQRLFDAQRGELNEVEYLMACIAHYERVIEHEQPEVVHAASNYVTALPALIAARRKGIPFVYEVRGFWEVTRSSRDSAFENSAKYRHMELFEGLVARHADRVLTITTAMKDELVERGVGPERIDIAFNSVDPQRFVARPRDAALASRLGLPDGVPVIGYVGSFVDYEGLDDLIAAAAGLQHEGHDFRLLLVGDGAVFESLEAQVRALGLEGRVLLTGRVPHDEVENYYSLIDIAPFPRKPWEVCELVSPLKPFEAMALSKAVIVSSTRALLEIVAHDETGIVFAKGDTASLQAALAGLLADPGRRAQIGARARRWIEGERSWTTAGAVCVAAYGRALACG